jgi:hypothetical protein
MPCGAGNTLYGGRRRRTSKKTRKMRGGNFVGVGQAIAPGVLERTAVANAGANPVTGALIPEPGALAGGRRRKSKKVSRKGGRKSRKVGRKGRKTMRGGGWNPGVVNSAGVGYGYGGTGAGGLADAVPYASRVGGAPMNADGVRSA